MEMGEEVKQHFDPWAGPLAPSQQDARREAARARRQAAEEERRQALLRKREGRERGGASGGEVGGGFAADADLQLPNMDLQPSVEDERREAARARRQAAEEERRQALLRKREGRATPDRSDHGAEIVRLQAALESLPAGAAHEASRAGLRKQLATHKAALLRDQRQREQAARLAAQLEAQQREAQQREAQPIEAD